MTFTLLFWMPWLFLYHMCSLALAFFCGFFDPKRLSAGCCTFPSVLFFWSVKFGAHFLLLLSLFWNWGDLDFNISFSRFSYLYSNIFENNRIVLFRSSMSSGMLALNKPYCKRSNEEQIITDCLSHVFIYYRAVCYHRAHIQHLNLLL